MKRTKLSVALMTSFVAALCLSSCSVTKSKTDIVSFVGYDGERVSLITNDFYQKYRNTESGVTTFYNAIMETLTRYIFETGDLEGVKSYNEIVTEAEKNLKGAKENAKEDASLNGTSYDTEMTQYLDDLGLEDEDELLEYFIYNLEKEEIEDWYFDNHIDELREEYIGVSDTGSATETVASSRFPYHIRHILLSVSDESGSFTRDTISESETKTMVQALDMLQKGTTEDGSGSVASFGHVAELFSSDSSASTGGDAGIMDTATSFVNEFKLGIYAYETAYASHSTVTEGDEADTVIKDGLGVTGEFNNTGTTVEDHIGEGNDIELGEVPYGVFNALGYYAEDTTDENGYEVCDGTSALYPRNIIWNQYLNLHNPFVITNEDVDFDYDGEGHTGGTLSELTSDRWIDDPFDSTSGKKVLADEAGRVIVGVRSEYGIHLMIIQKSIYDFSEGSDSADEVSLEEYYTTAIPGDDDYPTYTTADGVKKDKTTYVNNAVTTTEQSTLKARADTVKSSISSFDATYEYRLYEYYLETFEIEYTTDYARVNIGDAIDRLIETKRVSAKWETEKSLNESWRSYIEMIQLQNEERSKTTDEGSGSRLLPVSCAIGFKDANGSKSEDFEKGGVCYVE